MSIKDGQQKHKSSYKSSFFQGGSTEDLLISRTIAYNQSFIEAKNSAVKLRNHIKPKDVHGSFLLCEVQLMVIDLFVFPHLMRVIKIHLMR